MYVKYLQSSRLAGKHIPRIKEEENSGSGDHCIVEFVCYLLTACFYLEVHKTHITPYLKDCILMYSLHPLGTFNPYSTDPLPAFPKKQLLLKIISGQQLPKPPDSVLGDRGEVNNVDDSFYGFPVAEYGCSHCLQHFLRICVAHT